MAGRKYGLVHYLMLLVGIFFAYSLLSSYFSSSGASMNPVYLGYSKDEVKTVTASYHDGRATVKLADTHLANFDSFWSWLPTWKPNLLNAIDKYVDETTIFVDAGAWEGPALFYAARKAAMSLALEPDHAAFRALRAHNQVNPELENVILSPYCLSDRTEKIKMAGNGEGSSAIERVPLKFEDEKIRLGAEGVFTVSCYPLQEFLAGKGVRSEKRLFIKMDLQGAESYILPTLTEWVAARAVKPVIFLGIHETLENTRREKIGKILTFVQLFKLCGRDVDDLGPCSAITADSLKGMHDMILADY